MSGLPPVIDSTQPGTPSSEWARSTTTAALARTEPAPAFSATNDNTSIPLTTGGVSVSAADAAQKGTFAPKTYVAPANPGSPFAATNANDSTAIPFSSGAISVSAADAAQKGTFDPKTYHVAPTTPGSEFPGAYPTTPGEQPSVPQIPISANTVKETAASAATTAQSAAVTAGGYLQSAATTAAGYLPQGVIDTVTSYIPSSTTTSTMNTARASEHDTEHATSFPTREFSGASTGERTGGVGSLPGPLNEAGVTKLPHERVDEEKYMTAAAAATALAAGAYAAKDRVASALPSAQDAFDAKDRVVGSLPSTQTAAQTLNQAAQNTTQTVKSAAPAIPGVTTTTTHSTAVTASTIPSRELLGAQPGDHSSGAGALPGFQDEPHVARLPEESAHPQYDSGPMDNAAQAALKPSQERFGNESAVGEMRHVGGVGALVGGRDESSVALAPDERAGAATTTVSRVLPSQEPLGNEAAGAPKHVGGVGALPGNFNESGVAILPDARAQSQATGTQPKPSTPAPAVPPKDERRPIDSGAEKNLKNTTGGTHGKPNEDERGQEHRLSGDPGSGRAAQEQVEPRDEQAAPLERQADLLHATLRPRAHALGVEDAVWGTSPLSGTSAREQLDADAREEGGAYDTDYHPAALHPAPTHASSTPAVGERSQVDEARPDAQHADSDTSGTKAKKAGFMDKMKGEAKVLLGKIEHNQEKVEAGQKLKAGEA